MMRVGLGLDAHRFEETRPLVLGGVVVMGAPGLAGHSDGDVVSHAVAEALLGAANLGDLGQHFPNDDRWKDASSLEILSETGGLLFNDGWKVVNVDVTVAAERPRIAPHGPGMAGNIARALRIDPSTVSVKATTTDRLGFAGRGEGIAALAVALIEGI